MKRLRLITRDDVEARAFRLRPSPIARVIGKLRTNEWIEAYDNAEITRSTGGVPYYTTPAGWIHTAAVTLLDCHQEELPARITHQHRRGTPEPTKGTPTMTKPIETTFHDTEAILTVRNNVTGQVELFHIEKAIVTEQTGGKPNHILTIASEGWKAHALHGKDLAAKTWDIAKNLWATPTPDTATDPDASTGRSPSLPEIRHVQRTRLGVTIKTAPPP